MQELAEDPVATAKPNKPSLRGIPDVLATAAAIPLGIVLVRAAEPGWQTFSAAVFAIGLVAMLGTSALYHTPTWGPRGLARMQRLDHAGIFLLIAGSYAPFCLSLELTYGMEMMIVAFLACGLGALRALFVTKGGRGLRAAVYVLIGVAALPFAPSIYAAAGPETFALIGIGGALYIVGAGIYVAKRPNPWPAHFGCHEVFHLFVFAAIGCHYIAIYDVVTRG